MMIDRTMCQPARPPYLGTLQPWKRTELGTPFLFLGTPKATRTFSNSSRASAASPALSTTPI
jgi:hypothetical protein